MTSIKFPPLSISDRRPWTSEMILSLEPTLFLDERDIILTSNSISNWGNQVVGAADDEFFQTVASQRPITGTLNGYAAPFFTGSNGTNRYLAGSSGDMNTILGPDVFSVFMAVSCSEGSGSSTTVTTNPTVFADSSAIVGISHTGQVTNADGYRCWYTTDGSRKDTVAIPAGSGSIAILEFHHLSGSPLEFRCNNYVTASDPITTPGSGALTATSLIGMRSALTNQFNGFVGSVIAFNKQLSSHEREGIRLHLANKYSSISNLNNRGLDIGKTPLETAYTPVNILGSKCTICLAATMVTGSPIDRWYNIGSATNSDFIQTTILRPAVVNKNGLLVPDFDGSNDRLSGPPFGSGSNGTRVEFFVVFEPNVLSAPSASGRTDPGLIGQSLASFGIGISVSGCRAYINPGTAVSTSFTSGTLLPQTKNLVHAYYDNSFIYCRLNDNATVSASCTGAHTNLTSQIGLGVSSDNAAFFNGKIFDFIMCNTTASNKERSEVRTYLKNKWGLNMDPQIPLYAIGNITNANYFSASALTPGPAWQNGTGSIGIVVKKFTPDPQNIASNREYRFGRFDSTVAGYRAIIRDASGDIGNARIAMNCVSSSNADILRSLSNDRVSVQRLDRFLFTYYSSSMYIFKNGVNLTVTPGTCISYLPPSSSNQKFVIDNPQAANANELDIVSVSVSEQGMTSASIMAWSDQCANGGSRVIPGAIAHWEAEDWNPNDTRWVDRINNMVLERVGSPLKKDITLMGSGSSGSFFHARGGMWA